MRICPRDRPDRSATCHISCERYAAQADACRQRRDKDRKAQALRAYRIDSYVRYAKSLNRKK